MIGFDKKTTLLYTSFLLIFLAGLLTIFSFSPLLASSNKILSNNPSEASSSASDTNLHQVTKVIDGDTFEIEDQVKVRFIGVNTPETVDPNRPVQCYGKEASDHLKELLQNQIIRLVPDVSDKDQFGRLLRYVYLGDTFVNEELVRDGFAYAISYPPDIKYESLFQKNETEAKQNMLGLWKVCQ